MSRLGFSGLERDVAELVRRAAVIEAAPRGARGRVLAGVEAAILSGAGGPTGTATESTRPSIGGRLLERAALVAVGFMLGGSVGAFVTYERVQPVARVDSMLSPSSATSVAEVRVERAPGSATTAPGAPAVALGDLSRHDGPVPSPVPATRAVQATAATAGTSDGLADERRLLDAARGAVEREDGATGLAATAEHARKYPNGVLAQEREAIAVRALLLLGRNADARARLTRFRATFPDSLLLPALESSVEAASAP